MRLVFAVGNRRKLIILDNAVEKMDSYRQMNKNQKEAGGLLIGRHLLGIEHLVVDQLTEPSWRDKRSRNYFYRSKYHNKMLFKAWKDSDKTQTLLGLWHTHPEAIPTPSAIDLQDWRTTIHQGDYVGESLFFLIVGTDGIQAWQGDRSGQFVQLDAGTLKVGDDCYWVTHDTSRKLWKPMC